MNDFGTRPIHLLDRPFIYTTWLKSYKKESPFTQFVDSERFYKHHAKLIDKFFDNTNLITAVAHEVDDEEVILGYVIAERRQDEMDIIHYIFIKPPFRNFGIARSLLRSLGIDLTKSEFTHWTYDLDSFFKTHPQLRWKLAFNPYKT